MYILSYINTIEIYIVKLYPQVVLNTKKEFNSTFTIYFEIVIQMYGGWLRPCEKKVILFPQYNILFPQFIILFPQERYFVLTTYYLVPIRKIFCSHKKDTLFIQALWEFMPIPMQAPHHRQETNTKQKETREQKVSAVFGVIFNAFVAFSVWLLYYVPPYMFMFVLPLGRVMGVEITQNLYNPATHTCRCTKSGASSTLSESQLQFWTIAVIPLLIYQ